MTRSLVVVDYRGKNLLMAVVVLPIIMGRKISIK
jgi:hypothetical protein